MDLFSPVLGVEPCTSKPHVRSTQTPLFIRCDVSLLAVDQSDIRCDNGTNFVGAQRDLSQAIEEMDHDQIQDKLRKGRI